MAPNMKKPHKYNILVIADQPVARDGLSCLLNQESDFSATAAPADQVDLPALVGRDKPHLIVMDLCLPGNNPLQLAHLINHACPEIPILMLSHHAEAIYARRAQHAGAHAYRMKQEPTHTILESIRTICNHPTQKQTRAQRVSPETKPAAHPQATDSGGMGRLSDRELEVFELIGKGYSTRKIAELLGLNVKTIETHCAHIKQKLKLTNATELAFRAYHWVEHGLGTNI
jgi:DNA-binding NarL/FixJ family response regulator